MVVSRNKEHQYYSTLSMRTSWSIGMRLSAGVMLTASTAPACHDFENLDNHNPESETASSKFAARCQCNGH